MSTIPDPAWRLLALMVSHPALVGPRLHDIDPDTLGSRPLVVALASLAQGVPAAQVVEACRDEQVRARLWWMVSLREASAARVARLGPDPVPDVPIEVELEEVIAAIAGDREAWVKEEPLMLARWDRKQRRQGR